MTHSTSTALLDAQVSRASDSLQARKRKIMITHTIAFVAGVIVAVISPPVYSFAAAKVAQFRAWRANKG